MRYLRLQVSDVLLRDKCLESGVFYFLLEIFYLLRVVAYHSGVVPYIAGHLLLCVDKRVETMR